MVYAQQLLEFPLHAPYGKGRCPTGDEVSGGEMFPGARVWSYSHVLWELIELFDRHGDDQILLFPVGDEFDGFPF